MEQEAKVGKRVMQKGLQGNECHKGVKVVKEVKEVREVKQGGMQLEEKAPKEARDLYRRMMQRRSGPRSRLQKGWT